MFAQAETETWQLTHCLLLCFMKTDPEYPSILRLSQTEAPPFRTQHELAEILEALGQHLHAKTRLELSESGYYWHLAETIVKLGRLTKLSLEFPAVDEEFGHVFPPGTLAHEEQGRRFLSLIGAHNNVPDLD